jgi:LPS-assembly lipoprotein
VKLQSASLVVSLGTGRDPLSGAVPYGLSRRTLGTALLSAGLLGGCGFKLRGSQSFVFTSIAVLPKPGGAVAQELRRSFGDAVQVLGADVPVAQAQVVLDVLGEQREKTVVGVNASGQVREFQLRVRVKFRLGTPQGKELIAEDDILQQRDISYNESAALAKEAEEALLYRDMQTDIVQQILRRLAALKQIQ